MLGKLRIPINRWQLFVVSGGPFMDCPSTFKGVKMAKEIRKPCAVDIPTEVHTPDPAILNYGLLQALDLMLAGEPLYVGCMGGRGRTGLFLAILAKACGIPNPVEYVREHYYSHAVETKGQYAFVTDFPISPTVTEKLASYRRWSWLRFWKSNLTRVPVTPAEAVIEDAKKAWRRNGA